jgi:hypothetical protein
MRTAVEFLIDEIIKLTGVNIQMDEPIIEQAKQMEKEQIIDAWNNKAGFSEGGFLVYTDNRTAEDYYNETFKK